MSKVWKVFVLELMKILVQIPTMATEEGVVQGQEV